MKEKLQAAWQWLSEQLNFLEWLLMVLKTIFGIKKRPDDSNSE